MLLLLAEYRPLARIPSAKSSEKMLVTAIAQVLMPCYPVECGSDRLSNSSNRTLKNEK